MTLTCANCQRSLDRPLERAPLDWCALAGAKKTKSQRLTNSAGSVVSMIDLDPRGGETGRSSNQAMQPHRFTSYGRDANGGDDAMFRRHDAQWQRFAQPDPYDGSYELTDFQRTQVDALKKRIRSVKQRTRSKWDSRVLSVTHSEPKDAFTRIELIGGYNIFLSAWEKHCSHLNLAQLLGDEAYFESWTAGSDGVTEIHVLKGDVILGTRVPGQDAQAVERARSVLTKALGRI